MNNEKQKQSQTTGSALKLAWELGYTISVPLVVLALLGRFLDKKMGTEPWMLLGGIIFSIILTTYLVYRKTKEIIG